MKVCDGCREQRRKKTLALSKTFVAPRAGQSKSWTGRPKNSTIVRVSGELWKNAGKRAAALGKEFIITRELVLRLLVVFCENNYHSFAPGNAFRPSLDRVDNSKGYTPDNVRIVWTIYNLAKNRFTDAEVREFCQRFLGLPVD